MALRKHISPKEALSLATLVLSTVGNALGGPVGGAIGAMIGQSIDQELLAPVTRGPRVGDLSVQSSSYGTQIPRVYGTMRVAGSVIWSTDLIERTQAGGAKGQPDLTYAYTVSFAVALSSRGASSIGRIWADGNLLRGAADDMKVGGSLRFYDGSEDQVVDPLIGSIEGVANAPAYRGLTLAVFEDLELATFGNRIPFLTFEIKADEGLTTVGAILEDVSEGAIAVGAGEAIVGYAAYGRSVRDALQPLIEAFRVELFDDGQTLLEHDGNAPIVVGNEEFGNSSDPEPQPRLQRKQGSIRNLPGALRLKYYDPARDYQSGEATAAASERGGVEVQQDLAVAIDAGGAKTLAQASIARSWAQRDQLTLRLPPARLAVEPGTVLKLPLSPALWTVDQVRVEGFVVVTELHPAVNAAVPVPAEAGRIAENPDAVAGPISVALLDIADMSERGSAGPTLWVAASDAGSRWKSRSLEIALPGKPIVAQTARAKSVLGTAVSLLRSGSTDLFDEDNSVEVTLIDAEQWLTSCDDDQLAAGANLSVLGGELIQFGRAEPLGQGKFKLSHLLRGRGGTEWACGLHTIDETFCLLEAGTLQPVSLPSSSIGGTLQASGSTPIVFTGECMRPISPVSLTATLAEGGLDIRWRRRSRQGFAWIDEIDAPIGESSERYSVVLSGANGAVELTCDRADTRVSGDDLARLGAGLVSITVRQVGDFAMSRPAQINITLA